MQCGRAQLIPSRRSRWLLVKREENLAAQRFLLSNLLRYNLQTALHYSFGHWQAV
jgi:hypothetical protein